MAQRTILVCDEEHDDDVEATERRTFTTQGYTWVLDLCPEHARLFDEQMSHFMSRAERDRNRGRTRPSRQDVATLNHVAPTPNAVIRQWAKDQGYEIGDRGRISQDIKDDYAAEHDLAHVA